MNHNTRSYLCRVVYRATCLYVRTQQVRVWSLFLNENLVFVCLFISWLCNTRVGRGAILVRVRAFFYIDGMMILHYDGTESPSNHVLPAAPYTVLS